MSKPSPGSARAKRTDVKIKKQTALPSAAHKRSFRRCQGMLASSSRTRPTAREPDAWRLEDERPAVALRQTVAQHPAHVPPPRCLELFGSIEPILQALARRRSLHQDSRNASSRSAAVPVGECRSLPCAFLPGCSETIRISIISSTHTLPSRRPNNPTTASPGPGVELRQRESLHCRRLSYPVARMLGRGRRQYSQQPCAARRGNS